VIQPGVTRKALNEYVRDQGLFFPIDPGADASLGGMASTRASGTNAVRYGTMRENVLALKVVRGDGEIITTGTRAKKSSAGYDLTHLFIGAEGTLGIITAAVLKLFPLPRSRATAIVAVRDPDHALELLQRTLEGCGERLTGFELFSDLCLSLVLKHFRDVAPPFPRRFPHYVLMELSDTRPGDAVAKLAEGVLGDALERDCILDAALAQSETQAKAFWKLREFISDAQALEGPNIKHDVSIPISRIPDFIGETDAELAKVHPGVRMVTFGHVGDGNLHYNVSAPEGVAPDIFVNETGAINRIVHDIVARFRGSISAEHGLGQSKRDEIRRYKSTLELELMRKIKSTLDPHGIMNPGKVL
jgi:FAD/FMN-containing dehydrogenase